MIKRTTPKYRKITENLQDNSFTGTNGIDVSKPPTSRETVLNMANLEVDNDGGLRLRKPLVLKTNYFKLTDRTIIKVIKLYDTKSTFVICKENDKFYLYCYDETNNKLPIKFYDNNSEKEISVMLDDLANNTNWENVDYINTFDSTIISGVAMDLTAYASYYDSTTMEENYAKSAYRYFRIEIKDNECSIYYIEPEMNHLNSEDTISLNPNMSLDYAYAIRDNYQAQVVSCEGVLAYTLCEKDNLGKPIPTTSSLSNSLTVKVLTESDKNISYKLISSIDKNFTNNVYLKAFLNIKQSEKNIYYCIWEKTYDGVNWEEIDSFYSNVSEDDIQKINVKIGVDTTLDGTNEKYQTVRYRKLNCNSENDLVENRADCLKLDLKDISLKEATYRFTIRSTSKEQYSEDYTINTFTINDINILDLEDIILDIPLAWKSNIEFDLKMNIKVDDYKAFENSRITCVLYYRNYTYTSENNYTPSDLVINSGTTFNVNTGLSTIDILETFNFKQNLNGFYKTFPSKLLIMKDNIIMYEKNLVFHCYINDYLDSCKLIDIDTYKELLDLPSLTLYNASLEDQYVVPTYTYEATLNSCKDFTKEKVPDLETKIVYYYLGYEDNSSERLAGFYLNTTINLRSLYEDQLFDEKFPEFNENNWEIVCRNIRTKYTNLRLKIKFYSEFSNTRYDANILNFLYYFYDDLLSKTYNDFKMYHDYSSKVINISTVGFSFDNAEEPHILIIYNENHLEAIEANIKDIMSNEPNIDFSYKNVSSIKSYNMSPVDINTDFEIVVNNEDVLADSKTSLLTQQEYFLPLGTKTEILYNEYGSSAIGEKLYYKKAIYTYGLEQFKNNVFPSDTGSFITSLFNVIELDVTDGSAINVLIAWRDYLIAASDKSIYLITKVDTSYTTKTINTYIGISHKDRKTCKAILNGLIFKSGSKLYTLQPNPYSSNDTILNIKEISTPIENYIINTNYDTFAFTTEKAYFLFIPNDNETICLTYEYTRSIWQKYTYPVCIIDYNLDSIENIILIDNKGKEYYFNKELYEIPNELTADVLNNIPYADYIDYTLNEMEDFGTTELKDRYLPINFLLDSGAKTFDIVNTKQFVETKIILTTQNEQDTMPMSLDILVDGSPYPIHIDASTDAPFWKNNIWEKGSLSTLFISENTINNKTLKQGIFRYSGKGKTIEHIIKGSSIYNFKLYSIHFRFKNLTNKK